MSFYPENGHHVDLSDGKKWVLNPGAAGVHQRNTVEDQRTGYMLLERVEGDFISAKWFRVAPRYEIILPASFRVKQSDAGGSKDSR